MLLLLLPISVTFVPYLSQKFRDVIEIALLLMGYWISIFLERQGRLLLHTCA